MIDTFTHRHDTLTTGGATIGAAGAGAGAGATAGGGGAPGAGFSDSAGFATRAGAEGSNQLRRYGSEITTMMASTVSTSTALNQPAEKMLREAYSSRSSSSR